MADSKITALTSISTSTDPANDPLVIVDVSDTSMAATGTTKKVTLNNLLACSPTATLASATITGDLTVDTSTLKVDSANNRVGVNTATPASALDVYGETRVRSGNQLRVYRADNAIYSSIEDAGGGIGLSLNNVNGDGFLLKVASNNVYGVNNSYVQTWYDGAGGTRMTLNSTGLGIGASPSAKFSVVDTNGIPIRIGDIASAPVSQTACYVGAATATLSGMTNGDLVLIPRTSAAGNVVSIWTGNGTASERLRVDSSGNVGIGVTPSAWVSNRKALQIGGLASAVLALNGSNAVSELYFNSFLNTSVQNTYAANGYAGLFDFNGSATGGFAWKIAPSGTAGNAITFTQAMTLDASGNLLVGTTSAATSSGNGFKVLQPASGHFDPTVVTAQNSSIYSCWDIYSTGGTAGYRFYVTSTGTINAVNTTISAISDQRLKENVQDIDVGLGAILALKPRKFDWKAGKGKDIKGDRGFIAQEFEQVFPQLVDEWKDAAPEGEAPYKSVRQDLIPVLVKAIQELAAEVNALKNA